ncbi:MAG: molybdopterin oxidoreductase [Treponema sp.]|nr:MAG: molybdopterin oxidoreductase [Treponema sp.]
MKDFTCVACPVGCRLTATEKDDGEWQITGFSCKRGLEYGLQEMKFATRNFSTTVKIEGGFLPLVPVKTAEPISKEKILDAMKIIREAKVSAPVLLGDCIIPNILDTGVDIIATRTISEK